MLGDVKMLWRAAHDRAADQVLALREPETLVRYRRLWEECQHPDYLASVLATRKVIYFEVPKAACTTLKLLLSESLHGRFRYPPLLVHDRRKSRLPTIRQVGIGNFFRIVDDPDALIFSFVRNPYARIVSCYRDEVAPFAVGDRRAPIRREVGKFFGDRLKALDADKPLSFSWFVEMACATAQTSGNGHWLAMARLVPARAVRCNFVGRAENFDADIVPICERLGVAPTVGRTNPTGPMRLTDWIDAATAKAIRSAYAEDFDRFGYASEVP